MNSEYDVTDAQVEQALFECDNARPNHVSDREWWRAYVEGNEDGRALVKTLLTVDDIAQRIANAHRTMVRHPDPLSRARAYGRKRAFEASVTWRTNGCGHVPRPGVCGQCKLESEGL